MPRIKALPDVTASVLDAIFDGTIVDSMEYILSPKFNSHQKLFNVLPYIVEWKCLGKSYFRQLVGLDFKESYEFNAELDQVSASQKYLLKRYRDAMVRIDLGTLELLCGDGSVDKNHLTSTVLDSIRCIGKIFDISRLSPVDKLSWPSESMFLEVEKTFRFAGTTEITKEEHMESCRFYLARKIAMYLLQTLRELVVNEGNILPYRNSLLRLNENIYGIELEIELDVDTACKSSLERGSKAIERHHIDMTDIEVVRALSHEGEDADAAVYYKEYDHSVPSSMGGLYYRSNRAANATRGLKFINTDESVEGDSFATSVGDLETPDGEAGSSAFERVSRGDNVGRKSIRRVGSPIAVLCRSPEGMGTSFSVRLQSPSSFKIKPDLPVDETRAPIFLQYLESVQGAMSKLSAISPTQGGGELGVVDMEAGEEVSLEAEAFSLSPSLVEDIKYIDKRERRPRPSSSSVASRVSGPRLK